MWCAQTINPKKPIDNIAKIIPKLPKTAFDENFDTI
jgi:hypothetical protein